MKYRIYVIEDDENIRNLICVALENFGYCASGFETAEEALDSLSDLIRRGREAQREYPAMFVFDWMLPGMDGMAAIRKIREMPDFAAAPILMLTAKSDLMDRVAGLNAGADYYLTKPFDSRELLACINALLRRQGSQVDALSFGNTSLDLSSGTLCCGDKSVRLSAREFDVMRLLLQSGGSNLSKEALLSRVWGFDSNAVENSVEVYVGFLRKKLASIGSDVRIESVRRLGYHLEAASC